MAEILFQRHIQIVGPRPPLLVRYKNDGKRDEILRSKGRWLFLRALPFLDYVSCSSFVLLQIKLIIAPRWYQIYMEITFCTYRIYYLSGTELKLVQIIELVESEGNWNEIRLLIST